MNPLRTPKGGALLGASVPIEKFGHQPREFLVADVLRNWSFIFSHLVIHFGDESAFALWRITLRRRVIRSGQVRG
jgi:hypothetical protein